MATLNESIVSFKLLHAVPLHMRDEWHDEWEVGAIWADHAPTDSPGHNCYHDCWPIGVRVFHWRENDIGERVLIDWRTFATEEKSSD